MAVLRVFYRTKGYTSLKNRLIGAYWIAEVRFFQRRDRPKERRGGAGSGDPRDDLSNIDAFGKNEQVKKVFWALFVAMAGLVIAQVADPMTMQQVMGIIAGMSGRTEPSWNNTVPGFGFIFQEAGFIFSLFHS